MRFLETLKELINFNEGMSFKLKETYEGYLRFLDFKKPYDVKLIKDTWFSYQKYDNKKVFYKVMYDYFKLPFMSIHPHEIYSNYVRKYLASKSWQKSQSKIT